MTELELSKGTFVVEYYDPPTISWKQFGIHYIFQNDARSFANQLFKDHRGKMAVRVIYKEVIYSMKAV